MKYLNYKKRVKASSNNKFPRNFKHPGETILEVMVAIVLLSAVMISTFSTLSRAVSTNSDIRLRIMAVNIAREGIEGTRNIRDTNWLKYSGNRRGYWLCQDNTGGDGCDSSNPGLDQKIDSGNYILDYSEANDRYYLVDIGVGVGNKLDLEDPLKAVINANYVLFQDNTNSRFTHTSSGNTSQTPYYRGVSVELLDPVSAGFCTTQATCQDHAVRVTSTVEWHSPETSKTSKVVLETILYDYFERDSY